MGNTPTRRKGSLGFESLFRDRGAPRVQRARANVSPAETAGADGSYVSKTKLQKERARLERERLAAAAQTAAQLPRTGEPRHEKQKTAVQLAAEVRRAARREANRKKAEQDLAERIQQVAAQRRRDAMLLDPDHRWRELHAQEAAMPGAELNLTVCPAEARTVIVAGVANDPLCLALEEAGRLDLREAAEIYAAISQVHRDRDLLKKLRRLWHRARNPNLITPSRQSIVGRLVTQSLLRFRRFEEAARVARQIVFTNDRADSLLSIAEVIRDDARIDRARRALRGADAEERLALSERLVRLSEPPRDEDLQLMNEALIQTLEAATEPAWKVSFLRSSHAGRLARIGLREEARALADSLGTDWQVAARTVILLATGAEADLAALDIHLQMCAHQIHPRDAPALITVLLRHKLEEIARSIARTAVRGENQAYFLALVAASTGNNLDLAAAHSAIAGIQMPTEWINLRFGFAMAAVRCGKLESAMRIAATIKWSSLRTRAYLAVYCALHNLPCPFAVRLEEEHS